MGGVGCESQAADIKEPHLLGSEKMRVSALTADRDGHFSMRKLLVCLRDCTISSGQ
jgi:hypothetical protein